ncbi:hypothetical protein K2173_021034 [Erythroxylum novogranatense]|uniref:Uncharacterized protein n=1 Tax=Erythroxylum novogranatense TaxID=1862640 RepID=A0AAV8TPS2_9ROSI|nr:hypothetical protein K2173_021034 [Erythroxylum novogranatense]
MIWVFVKINFRDISMKRHDSLSGEKVLNINVKKLNSLPQIQDKKSTGERKILAILAPDSSTSIADENGIQEVNDLEKKSGGYAVGHINSYQKQIKKLDKWVKDISDCKDPGRHKANFSRGSIWSPSLFSQASAGNVLDSMREEDHSDQFNHLENYQEKEVIVNATCSPGVQDIIEVPQTIRICKSSEAPNMECQILNTKGENKLGSADLTSDEYFDSVKEAETDCIKTMMLSPGCQKRPQKPRDGMSIDCNVSVAHPDLAAVVTQTDFGQLSQRIEQLERARTFNKQEIADVRDNELKLLKEINEQLKSIKSEMKTLKAETSPLPDRPTLDLLQEVYLVLPHYLFQYHTKKHRPFHYLWMSNMFCTCNTDFFRFLFAYD